MDNSSTEFLLGTSKDVDQVGQSTADLIDGGLSQSTGSLIKKDVQELLKDIKASAVKHEGIGEDAYYMTDDAREDESVVTQIFRGHIHNINDSRINDRNLDPLLPMLYNKIQVFLLRNDLSLDFLVIFERYVDILIELGLDPLQDHLVLTLQNELDKSWELTPNMTNILTAFLMEPENMAMKLAFFEHKLRRGELRRIFMEWKLDVEARQSLKQLESIWERYLTKKHLYIWQQKLDIIKENLDVEAKNFSGFRIKSGALDQWMGQMYSQHVKQKLADTFFLEKHFKTFNRVRSRLNSTKDRAVEFRKNKLMKAALLQWKLKYKLAKFKPHSCSELARRTFNKLRAKLDACKSLQDRADFMRNCLLLEVFFQKWTVTLDKNLDEEDKLVRMEEVFVKRRALNFFKVATKERENDGVVRDTLNLTLVRFVFSQIWLKRLQERKRVWEFFMNKNSAVMSKFLSTWRLSSSDNRSAKDFRRSKVEGRVFKNLQLYGKLMVVNEKRQNSILASVIKIWHKKSLLQSRLKLVNEKQLQNFWNEELRAKFEHFSDLELVASEHHDTLLVKRFFFSWADQNIWCKELTQKADLFRKLRIVLKLKSAAAHSKEVNAKAKVVGPLSEKRYFLKTYMNIWVSNTEIQKRLRLETILDQFLEMKEKETVQSFFSFWDNKLFFYNRACIEVAIEHENRKLCTLIFKNGYKKMELHKDWETIAQEVRNKSLMLSAYSSLRERNAEIDTLNTLMQQKRGEKDLKLLIKCMNIWTMRHLKCKRNDETVEVFKNRWNRAGLRAIILLWKDKIDASLVDQFNDPPPENYSHNNGLSDNLVTPTRIKGANQITIPGSEIIKRNRMEAMRNHYRSARRAIPSPIKSSDTLDSISKRKLTSSSIQGSDSANRRSPPPKMDLEKINRKLATNRRSISFKRIPEPKFSPFGSPSSSNQSSSLVIDRTSLSDATEELADSPTRR